MPLDENGFVIYDDPDAPPPDDGSLPAHLTRAAIDECGLCDRKGYRGAVVCDHREHASAETRAAAREALRVALGKGGAK